MRGAPLITNRCPHSENTPVGELCKRCEQEGVGLVELDADGEGVVTFLVPISQGLTLQELRELVPKEIQDEALVRRKLMTEEELQEAMLLDPSEEDPEAAEEEVLEVELAWKVNLFMTDLVRDLWCQGTLYMVPEARSPSFPTNLM
jgi:hypothetical protein